MYGVAQVGTRHGAEKRCLIHRVAHLQLADGLHEFGREGLRDRCLQDEAFRANANLPIVVETRLDRGVDTGIHVRVRKHDERV